MPVGIGGGDIFAVQQQHPRQRRQYFGPPGRCFARIDEDRARLAALVAQEVQARKVQLQVDGSRRQCETAFDDRDGLVDPSGLGKLAGEFLEGRRKWRPPRRRPAQLLDRFRAASGAAQRRAQQGFDTGIVAAARCLFERRDRLVSAVLREQGPSQDRRRAAVSVRLALRTSAASCSASAKRRIRSASAARSSAPVREFACPRLTDGEGGCFGTGAYDQSATEPVLWPPKQRPATIA